MLHHMLGAVEEEETVLGKEIEELIKCIICHDRVRNPHECPHCSHMSCKSCLVQWVRKSQTCPECRKYVLETDLRRSWKMEQLLQTLVKKKKNTKIIQKTESKKPLCKHHQMPLLYYCTACDESLCSDCLLFAAKDHSAHKTEIKKMEEIIKIKLDKLQEMNKEVNQELYIVDEIKRRIAEHTELIKRHKNEQVQRLKEFYKQTREKIETEYKRQIGTFTDAKEKIQKRENRIQRLASVGQGLYQGTLSSYNLPTHTISQSVNRLTNSLDKTSKKDALTEIVEHIQQVKALKHNKEEEEELEKEIDLLIDYQLDELKHKTMIGSEIDPPYVSYTYGLPGYMDIRTTREYIYSPEFSLRHLKWRLKIYLNGTDANQGEYLSVFLELQSGMEKGEDKGKEFQYRITLKHPTNPEKDNSREFTSFFQNGECWGYNRFHSIHQILEEGYIDATGSLQFEFSLRYPHYQDTVIDMQEYIDELEEIILQQQMEEVSEMKSAEYDDLVLELYKEDKREDPKDSPPIQKPKQQKIEEAKDDTLKMLDAYESQIRNASLTNNYLKQLETPEVRSVSLVKIDSSPMSPIPSPVNTSTEFNQVVQNAQKIIFGNNLDLNEEEIDHETDEEESDIEDSMPHIESNINQQNISPSNNPVIIHTSNVVKDDKEIKDEESALIEHIGEQEDSSNTSKDSNTKEDVDDEPIVQEAEMINEENIEDSPSVEDHVISHYVGEDQPPPFPT